MALMNAMHEIYNEVRELPDIILGSRDRQTAGLRSQFETETFRT